MGRRGVSRPTMPVASPRGHDGHAEPYSEARYAMLAQHHRQTLWIPWTLVLLGIWMLLAPVGFGHLEPEAWVQPSGGRGVWFGTATHIELRAWLLAWSDVLAGLALCVLGWRALEPGRPVTWWLLCCVGVWLSVAPVALWAPTAAAYSNDTLVGMLVIALTILVPGMPNMVLFMRMGGSVPPGWTYNPSSWPQRWIMIATGFLGWLVSRQLAMYQLGYVSTAFDPFFGEGSRRVLDSRMSHALPVSDAALGTLAYTFEFLMGFMGGPSRWRTMPWMVALFGILVIPLGLVHIALVVSQPVIVGHWCSMCLIAAAIMLPMIPLEVDEVVAMVQHVRQAGQRGESRWRVFWTGGSAAGSGSDERSPDLHALPRQPGRVLAASLWGMSAPIGLVVAACLGVVLMATPGMLAVTAPAAHVYHLGGALIVVVAVVSMGEVLRRGRVLAVPIAVAVALLPWVLGGAGTGARLVGLGAGIVAAILCLPVGPVRESYGTWNRFVR